MADEDGFQVLDGKGRLFGLVNIVDALVVLLVLALLVGGIALVQSAGDDTAGTPTESRYVTLDFGAQPSYVATQMDVGDTWNDSQSGERLVLTDIYRFERGDIYRSERDNRIIVVARAEVVGTVGEAGSESVFQFRNDQLRIGDRLQFETPTYSANPRIAAIDETGETLPVDRRRIGIRANVSAAVADSVAAGDEYRIDGESIATVENVERTATADPDRRRVELELDVLALRRGETTTFAGRPLRVGATIPFRTNEYELSGEIIRVST